MMPANPLLLPSNSALHSPLGRGEGWGVSHYPLGWARGCSSVHSGHCGLSCQLCTTQRAPRRSNGGMSVIKVVQTKLGQLMSDLFYIF
jgi:hypothetical protein